jgi:periplasmic protein TonB
MSNLSIFDKKWIDVVFDGKNKEYGAYQLRQETQKTSLRAFAFGTLIVLSCIGIFTLSSFFSADNVVIDDEFVVPLVVTKFKLPEEDVVIPEPIIEKLTTERVFSKEVILVNPIVTLATNATQNIALNTDIGKTTNDPTLNTGTVKPENPTSAGNTTETIIVKKVVNTTPRSIKELDTQPMFPGGIQKFYNYVGNNFNKPELDEDSTVTVKVSFIVEIDGSMSNIKVLEDPGYGMGQEAIRVLKSLKTNWTAGILDGEKVRTFYNLPITVNLE